VGVTFYGSAGFLVLDDLGFQVYKSTAANISGEAARGAGAGRAEKYEKIMDEAAGPEGGSTTPHVKNFFEAIRARDYKKLTADVAIGARAAAFCHLANMAYRTGRTLRMAQSTGTFIGDDEANGLLTRDYREPYVVSENV
jgi:hypothetical protein